MTSLSSAWPLDGTLNAFNGHDRASKGTDADADSKLEGSLTPIVRLALRRGVGIPALVQWVRKAHAEMARDRQGTPEQFAPQIACMLARVLTRPPEPRPLGNTVRN